MIAAILSVKVLTHLLPLEEYGRLGLAMTVMGSLGMLIFFPLGQVVDRFAPEYWWGAAAARFRAAVFLIFAGLATVLLVVVCIFGIWLFNNDGAKYWSQVIILSALFSILSGAVVSLIAYMNAHRRRAQVVLIQAGDAWLRFALAALFVWGIAPTATSVVIGYLVGSLLTLSILAPFLRDVLAPRGFPLHLDAMSARLTPELIRYAVPFSIASVFSALALYSDRWVVSQQLGEADLGVYYAMVQFGTALVGIIVGPLVQFIQPIVYNTKRDIEGPTGAQRSVPLLYRAVGLFGLLMTVVLLPIALAGPQLMSLLTPLQYYGRGHLLWLVVLGIALFQAAQTLAISAQIHKAPERNILPKMVHGVTMVTMSFVLARCYGFTGVCAAVVISSTLYLGAILLSNRAL